MKPALESVMEYLDANGIKYELKHPHTIWFSLIVPTPETPGTPNRVVSCSIRIPQAVIQTLHFSVAVMAVELSEELFQQVASFFMRYQSTELKIGQNCRTAGRFDTLSLQPVSRRRRERRQVFDCGNDHDSNYRNFVNLQGQR